MSRELLEDRIERLSKASRCPGNRRGEQIQEMKDLWFDINMHDDRAVLGAKFRKINRRHVPLRGLDG